MFVCLFVVPVTSGNGSIVTYVTFWQRALITKLESDGWSSYCRVTSSSFQIFPSHSPVMS